MTTPAQKQVRRAKSAPHSWTVARVGKRTCGAGESGRCRQLGVHSCFTRDQMTRHLDVYRCTLLCGTLWGSFKETAPRKTAENTAKHCGGGVGSVVANHRGGSESSMVITTLIGTISFGTYKISVQSTSVHKCQLALLRWPKFATRSVAVFCLTHHRGVGGSSECRAICTALGVWFNHLSCSLLRKPHHTAHVNRHRRR